MGAFLKAFILGASGQIGFAVAELLLRAGWSVTCAQRGDALPELLDLGASSARCDRTRPGDLRRAIGDGADVVIDAVAFDETDARSLIDVQDVVKQFVVISSASVYRDERGRTLDEAQSIDDLPEMPVPILESQPTVAPGPQTYSTQKVALERTMLDRCRSIVSIVRPCAIYGPHSKHPREWWFVKRMLDGRRRIALAGEQSRFQTSATVNIARVIETAIDASFTGILHAGDPDSPSIREIGEIVAAEFGWEGSFTAVPFSAEIGVTPWSMPHPFLLSMEAVKRLGYEPAATYRDYAPPTCRWLERVAVGKDWRTIFPVLAAYPELFDYAGEDAYFTALRTAESDEANR